MRTLINRPEYLRRFMDNKDIDLVKIITGIRRCGKSAMLDIFRSKLLESGTAEENIIQINFESLKYAELKNYEALYKYIAERLIQGSRTYLLFDELQEVSGWEKAIESLRLDFDVDIYITGSNAHLLSTEFSTLLSGRYVEIRILPLSFKEFIEFHNFRADVSVDEKFQKYLQIGGMPILRQTGTDNAENAMSILEGIYSTVVLRDILQRAEITDSSVLQKLVNFLCSNIGSITSPNSIGNVLRKEKNLPSKSSLSVAGKTVEKYLKLLQDAYFFYPVARYDVKGKQLLKTLQKHYIADIGFRNLLLGYRDADRGHILENIVYIELLRRGYKVYVGKSEKNEIDFVAEKTDNKIYVQVAETIAAEETLEREFKPLISVNDNYEKIILSMDKSYLKAKDGIKLLNVIDWLLETEK